MQTYSQAFHNAISAADREIRGYIKFNGTFTLDGAGGLISFKTTQNAMDAERFCVGSVCSAMCEATFYNEGLSGSGVSLANSYFDAYIGVVTDANNNTVEYVCCGRYYISEITRSTATTRIVGYDIAGRLSMDYVPTVTADPDHGYLVMDILNDIISQTGVNGGDPFTTFGDDVYLPKIYEGNCRAQWGWLCSLVDGTASNYSGTREPADLGYIKTYVAGNGVATPYAVDETTTYMDGLSLGDAYTITSFTSGTTDEPIVVGNGTGLYGLNPYMTTAVATTIEQSMDNYTYYPATLHWRGDPCLDILDEINVTKGADTFKVVAMKIETTFNGGLEQTISCYGDSEAYYALSTSPTQGAINRVSGLVQEIQQAIETADGGVITKVLDTDGTWKELVIANNQDLSQATSVWRFNINGLAHSNRYQGGTYTLAMDTQGRIVANVIQTGILQDAQGKNSWNLDTGAFTITNGSINITTTSEVNDQIYLQWNDGNFNNVATSLWSGGVSVTDLTNALHRWYEIDRWGFECRQNNSGGTASPTISRLADATLRLGTDATAVSYGVGVGGDLYVYDSSGTQRTHIGSTGTLYQYDANGKVRTYLEYGDIFLYTSAEKRTVKLSGATFSALGGSLQLYDPNANERVRLHADGLSFFNASGTQTASYPSTGLPMLSADPSVNSTNLVGKSINMGEVYGSTIGVSSSSTHAQVAEAWLKWVVTRYTNAQWCTFEGIVIAGVARMMKCYIYDTSDIVNYLPKASSGVMQNYDGSRWYFRTNNGFYFNRITKYDTRSYAPSNTSLTFSTKEAFVYDFGNYAVVYININITSGFNAGTEYPIFNVGDYLRTLPRLFTTFVPNQTGTSAALVEVKKDGTVYIYRYSGSGAFTGWLRCSFPIVFSSDY